MANQSLGKRDYNQFQYGTGSSTTSQNKLTNYDNFSSSFNYLNYENYKYPINTTMVLHIAKCDVNTLPYIHNFQSKSEYFNACKQFIAYQLWDHYIGLVDLVILNPVREFNPISRINEIKEFKVTIYFNSWYNNEQTYWMQQELVIDNIYRFHIHNDWYWNFTIYYKPVSSSINNSFQFNTGSIPIPKLTRQ